MKHNNKPDPNASLHPDIDTSMERFVLQVGTPQRPKPSYKIQPIAEQQRQCLLEQQQRNVQNSVNAVQKNGRVMVKYASGGLLRSVSPLDAVRLLMNGEAQLA